MTISTTANNIRYSGNGSTTAFPTTYEFPADADLVVNLIDDATGVPTLQTIVTHYTVSGAGDPSGGTVTMVTAPASGQTLDITRWINPTQPTDYIANDPLPAEVLEDDFDRVVMICQQILNRVGGATFSINEFTYMARSATNLEEWDAQAKVIHDVADGVNPQDAVTKAQLDAVVIASGNLPSGDPANNILVSNGTAYVTNTPSAARTALGLVIGTDVQAFDAALADISAITPGTKGDLIVSNTTDFVALTVGSNNQIIVADSAQATGMKWADADSVVPALPRGYIDGLVISDAADADHDRTVSAGSCRDSTDAVNMVLASAMTKRIDATWVAGTGNGGLSSSLTAPANNTWYYVFLIVVGGSVDVGFDTSITAANLVADHSATSFRLIGARLTDGSANLLPGRRVDDWFLYTTPIVDINRNNPGTGLNTTDTVSAPPNTTALMVIGVSDATPDGTARGLIISTSETNVAPSDLYHTVSTPGTSGLQVDSAMIRVDVDASSLVRTRFLVTTSDAGIDFDGSTLGFIEPRGLDG